MTARKPPGVGWESWVEQQIREARERGEFDDLPGHGKPLPDLDRPRDEMWWVRKKMQRERVSYSPPAISLRREVDEALEQIAAAKTEARVRALVASINERIRYVNSHTITGPPTTVGVLDVETVVERWRQQQ
jgi:transglutaminase-like putative cysteine protease